MTLTISRLVAQVESENQFSAVRFEPAWRYVTRESIKRFHEAHRPVRMTDSTVRTLLSCSWGKYQMMGSNLYDMGFSSPLVTFAASEYLQDVWFEIFLEQRKIKYTLEEIISDRAKRENFAKKYNGDAATYSIRLMNVYNFLKGQKDV
jgi:N-acetylmuramidase